MRLALLLAAAAILAPAPVFAQDLVVKGPNGRSVKITAAEVAALPA